jgi:translation initiation factor 2B subunit (eIF-2B alpha/beta/delta family)
MTPEFKRRIALLASDRESGASEILDEALAILRDALAGPADLVPVARALCRAQPTMAPIWNASIAALGARDDPERFTRFTQRVARAPDALARFGLQCFNDAEDARQAVDSGGRTTPLRLVTISFSRSVVRVLEVIAQTRSLRVACSEGRPALEGRRLATRLATAGIPVTCFTDAAIGHALGGADAVLVGADAVAPEWFLNKSGTRMLAATAAQQGVPLYVLASRDKFVSHAIAGRLAVREGESAEVWEGAPAGVAVHNPYFESTPLDLVTAIITDAGVLGAALAPEVCASMEDQASAELIAQLHL